MTKLSKVGQNMATVALILAVAASCSQQPPAEAAEATGTSKVVAMLDGEPITDDDLAIKGELIRLEQEAYKARQEALDNVIRERVLAKEAKENGIDVEELLKANVDGTITKPTPAEVRMFYEQRKSRFRKAFRRSRRASGRDSGGSQNPRSPPGLCRRPAQGQQGRDSDFRAPASRQC